MLAPFMGKYQRIPSGFSLSPHTCSGGPFHASLNGLDGRWKRCFRIHTGYCRLISYAQEQTSCSRRRNPGEGNTGAPLTLECLQRQRENKEMAEESKQLQPHICSSQLSRFISIDSAAPSCLVRARSSIAVELCIRSIMLMSSPTVKRASLETLGLHVSNLQMHPGLWKSDTANRLWATARSRFTCRVGGVRVESDPELLLHLFIVCFSPKKHVRKKEAPWGGSVQDHFGPKCILQHHQPGT